MTLVSVDLANRYEIGNYVRIARGSYCSLGAVVFLSIPHLIVMLSRHKS